MTSIPRRRTPAQARMLEQHREALRLAAQLTPLQRHLIARAGMARWFQLPAPWQPTPGRQEVAAKALSSTEYGVLESVPEYLEAYQLTPLGELVAGIWVLSAIALP